MNNTETPTTMFSDSELVFVEMALQDAAEKYRESAARLRTLEVTPGQFAAAIDGQVQMENQFLKLLNKVFTALDQPPSRRNR